MPDLSSALSKYQSAVDDVQAWTEAEYNRYFADHFKRVRQLYDRMKSTEEPITDAELEWILTWLPLELINVAEKLSNLKTVQETIKVEIKSKETQTVRRIIELEHISETKAKEKAAAEFVEDKMLLSVYDSLAERVGRETSFAKELIMSCKKIWDARRNAEQPMPSITSNDPEALPEYHNKPSTYIK